MEYKLHGIYINKLFDTASGALQKVSCVMHFKDTRVHACAFVHNLCTDYHTTLVRRACMGLEWTSELCCLESYSPGRVTTGETACGKDL